MTEILRADVDYITVTARLSQAGEVYNAARDVARDLEQTFTPKRWRFYGYEGWLYRVGELGHFAYGESMSEIQGCIVQASGVMSSRSWYRFNVAGNRVTRIDLAVDAKPAISEPGIAKECYRWISNHGIKKRAYSLIENTMGGETLYVGSRQSDSFGRLYDKGVQSGKGRPGELWRYEIELKAARAKEAYMNLLSLTGARGNIDSAICSTVYDWFDTRNVPPIFRRNSVLPIGLSIKAQESSEQRKLMWLRTQVSPSVRELILSGNREVLDALGITEFFNLEKKSLNP